MMLLYDFCEIYEVPESSMFVALGSGAKLGTYITRINKTYYVDDKQYVKDIEDVQHKINIVHDLYYLLERVMSDSLMATLIVKLTGDNNWRSWLSYMSSDMFKINSHRQFELSVKQQQFLEYAPVIYYWWKVRRAYDGVIDFRLEAKYLGVN